MSLLERYVGKGEGNVPTVACWGSIVQFYHIQVCQSFVVPWVSVPAITLGKISVVATQTFLWWQEALPVDRTLYLYSEFLKFHSCFWYSSPSPVLWWEITSYAKPQTRVEVWRRVFFFFLKILNPPKTTFACSSPQEKLPVLFLLVNASMLPTKGTEPWPNQSCTQHL